MITSVILVSTLLNFVTPQETVLVLQEDSSETEAIFAAAEYVLAEDAARRPLPDPGRILVDVASTLAFSTKGNPIEPSAKVAAIRLANVLGARAGRLEDVITCRERFPSPEEMLEGIGRCSLEAGIDLVVQLSNPALEDGALYVWIALWKEINGKQVSVQGREVKLVQDAVGRWVAVEVRTATSGHY